MRDLLYKNLTSQDKKRRAVSTLEIADDQGVESIVRRHFICILKEIEERQETPQGPYVYVLKERQSKEQKEKFFCKVKGGVYVAVRGRLFLAQFLHSLRIDLSKKI